MKLSGEVLIEASADTEWEIIGHRFADIGDWRPRIPDRDERIVTLDDAARTLHYEATGLPGFVREARNRWQVTAAGPDRARARFDGVLRMRGPLGRLVALPIRLRMLHETRTVLDDLRRARHAVNEQASPTATSCAADRRRDNRDRAR